MYNKRINLDATKGELEMEKKLYKSLTDKKICGVCAGFAEYLNLDVTLVRVAWAVITLFAGVGLLAYIIAALVMPTKQ